MEEILSIRLSHAERREQFEEAQNLHARARVLPEVVKARVVGDEPLGPRRFRVIQPRLRQLTGKLRLRELESAYRPAGMRATFPPEQRAGRLAAEDLPEQPPRRRAVAPDARAVTRPRR